LKSGGREGDFPRKRAEALVRIPFPSFFKAMLTFLDRATSRQRLGVPLLMARRLCERDAGFVTVTTSFAWDMHADANNAPMTAGMDYAGRPFDHAVSAFIEDVEARGLSGKILLVCCDEMGRSLKNGRQSLKKTIS
jgi:hypothetical protein